MIDDLRHAHYGDPEAFVIDTDEESIRADARRLLVHWLIGAVPEWRNDAACAGTSVEVFFPPPGQRPDTARAICVRCPVAADCLEEALDAGPDADYGIRAGLTGRERKAMRKERAA